MKKVLIIGASGGIGSEILKEFIGPDCMITATSTRSEKIEEMQKDFPSVNFLLLNQADRNEDVVINKAFEQMGGLDCVIVASGITSDGLCMRLSDELWDKTIEINLSSSFRIARAAFKKMLRSGGCMIFTSSVIARMGNAGQVAYAASKAGLEGMVKTLAREFAGKNIRVNCIAPGFIKTKMTENLDLSEYTKNIPLKRVGEACEVAFAMKFLADDRASYITGHTLEINGGMWMS
jgi:3-oxoacyl-[acyl-carrier protein] reductase